MRKIGLLIFFCFALMSSASAQFTFECFCGYLTAADSNCDVCTSGQQSRYFKGLLIRKDGVVHKWIEQPYTILQNFDALTFKELIPGAEQIRITLAGTPFDSIQQFRDSVMCPCSGGAGVLVIEAGPGINIYGDTIASIPQQIDTFDLVSGTADTIRLSLTRDSVPFHFVILPPDSDNQYIDTLRLTGTTLEISLFGDNIPLSTVDLSSLVADGSETIVTGTNGITVTGTGTMPDPYVVGMPTGTNTQTLRHNGTAWIANSLLRNDGADVGINTAPSTTALLKIKQTTDTDGIAIERSSDTRQLQLQQGSDAIIQSTASNLFIKATSGELLLYGPGGGGNINQIDVAAQSAVTSNFGNGALLRLSATYAPTAAGGDFGFLKFLPTINQTGAADQNIYFMDFVPTLTGVTGTIHGIRYWPSIGRFLWQPNGAGVVVNHLAGNTGIGSGSTTPAQTLHVQGTARVTGSDGTATTVVGRDGDGDISALGLSGLTITAGTLTVTADGDGSSTNEGILGVSAGGANDALLTSNTSGAVGVTYSGGTGITVSESTSANGGTITITNAGDLSTTNELQTLANTSAATTHTVTLSNSGGSVQLSEGSGVSLTTTGTGLDGVVTIANTGDLSATNEAWTVDADDADTELITTQTVKFQGGGIVVTDYIPGTDILTITGTEVDGSTSNELQTIANTSSATTHTATLSNGGGSIQLVEGANVTLTTTGTGLDGIVTIAATSGSGTDLSFSGAGSPVTLVSNTGTDVTITAGTGISLSATGTDITITNTVVNTDAQNLTIEGAGPTYDVAISGGTDVTIQGGGIVTLSESPANTLIVTATEVDGSVTNEAWTVDANAGDTEVISNQTLLFSGAGIATTSYSSAANSVTITATEVDGSTSNELQTLANTSAATTHTVTLSNSGGSVQLAEGTGVTLTTTGTGLDGVVTIANTGDLSATNEAWTIDGDDADTELITTQTVKFQGGGIVITDYITGTDILTITATEVDGSITNEAWTVDADDADTEVIGNQTVKFQGAGITTTDYNPATDVLLITSTEVDGSVSNELQTLANTSAATTHTVTLSNSGGSVQLAEGTNVTLTTTGTGLDGIVTIAAASGPGTDLSFSGASSPVTLNSSTGTDVTFTQGGIVTISATSGNITITGTEVDGSTSNELQTLANTSDATSHTATLSNSGGSIQLIEGTGIGISTGGTGLNGTATITNTGDLSATNEAWTIDGDDADTELITTQTVKFQGGGIVVTDYVPGTDILTITGTEVDGSTTNELQTLANTSTSTTHVATLSNSGGSVTMSEGSGITIATTGTTLDGIATITAVDPSLSNEGSLTVNAGTGSTSVISSNTAGSTDVTITAGAGLSISEVGNVITLANTGDLSTTNELQTLSNTSNATTHTVTLSNSGGSIQLAEGSGIALATTGTGLDGVVTVSSTIIDTDAQNLTIEGAGPTYDVAISGGTDVTISGAGIITLSESPANTLILTGTEVDGSVTNEGTLGVSAGSGTSSVITSNTSGATGVTVNAAGILAISETTSANGGSITLTATEVDGSTSNELQTLANTSTATTHTVTLSNSGGSIQLVEGAGIFLATTGTGLDGIVTVSADPTAGLNGIYGDGTAGSGDDALPPGGSNVTIPNDNSPLDFLVNAGAGNPNPFLAIRVITDYCADDAVTKYFVGKSPSDSLSIENFDCGAVLNQVGGTLTLQTDKELYLVGDSVNVTTVPARTVMPYLVGITTGGWLRKIEGTATGQILVWDEPNGWWEIGSAPGGGTVTGTGTANRVAYWTGTSAIAADADFAFDGSYVGIGTTTLTARLNVNENASLSSPFVANFYSASTAGGNSFINVANTTTTGTASVGLGQSALGSYPAAITRYGSTHASRAKELNIGTFEASAPLTFTMNTTVRMTVASDANVYVANKIYAGAGTTVTGAHSSVQNGGSFAGPILETVGAPTFDDTKHVVVYIGTTNVTWTLPTASGCTGRYYWLHHSNTSGTVTLSQSVTKGNGGNFNTITAGQWAFIVSTGSGWRGFKIASL